MHQNHHYEHVAAMSIAEKRIILKATSSRQTIVNHLRQSIATVAFEPMEARLALCAVEQSYLNTSMTVVDRRRAIGSARWTAAIIAPAETLSPALRAQVEDARRREHEEAARIAAYKATHAAAVTAKASKLTAKDVAEITQRITYHLDRANSGECGKSSRKRHRTVARDLQELVKATGDGKNQSDLPR